METKQEEIDGIKHVIRATEGYIGTFRAARDRVLAGEEYLPQEDESNEPRRCYEVRDAICDAINGYRMMYVRPDNYPDDMAREAKRLSRRYLLIFSKGEGPFDYENIGCYPEKGCYGDYSHNKNEVSRTRYPKLIEDAKAPFLERCAKLMEKKLDFMNGQLEKMLKGGNE